MAASPVELTWVKSMTKRGMTSYSIWFFWLILDGKRCDYSLIVLNRIRLQQVRQDVILNAFFSIRILAYNFINSSATCTSLSLLRYLCLVLSICLSYIQRYQLLWFYPFISFPLSIHSLSSHPFIHSPSARQCTSSLSAFLISVFPASQSLTLSCSSLFLSTSYYLFTPCSIGCETPSQRIAPSTPLNPANVVRLQLSTSQPIHQPAYYQYASVAAQQPV